VGRKGEEAGQRRPTKHYRGKLGEGGTPGGISHKKEGRKKREIIEYRKSKKGDAVRAWQDLKT